MINESQKKIIEQIKIAYEYDSGIKDFKIFDEGKFAIVSWHDKVPFGHFYIAIIGKKGGIRTLTKHYYFDSKSLKMKGKEAIDNVFYILREMNTKGLYEIPMNKPKKIPTYGGIKFYSVDDNYKQTGLHNIGIERTPATEKYFRKHLPDSYGDIIAYAYIANGGDGIIKFYDDTETNIPFFYEPGSKYINGLLYVNSLHYEEILKNRLSNRQIISRIMKAYIKTI